MASVGRLSAVLVDDHQVFLDGFVQLMALDGRIHVVAAARSSAEGLAAVESHRPDLVVLDVAVDRVPAERNVRQILRISPRSVVVMVSAHDHAPLRERLLQAGARAYFTKTLSGVELIDAFVNAAGSPAPEPVVRELVEEAPSLTLREQQVLRLMSLGYSNKQIGVELKIAEGTVKQYIVVLFRKLGARSRLDAVRRAVSLDLFGDSYDSPPAA